MSRQEFLSLLESAEDGGIRRRKTMSTPYASDYPHAHTSTESAVTRTLWGIAIVWLALSSALGASGFYAEHRRLIFFFVLTPVAAFVVAFAVSRSLRAWAFALDTRALVFIQAVRMGGFAFLAAYAAGNLNGEFALWAGLMDTITGLSAPFAAQYLTPTRTMKQRRLLVAWMTLGIIDFAVAIPLAAIIRASDPASVAALTAPPLSMITTWGVPMAIMGYFILGAHLWRQRGRA